MEENKESFGFDYWFKKLALYAKIKNPEKLTPAYIEKMREMWLKSGALAKMHRVAIQRQREVDLIAQRLFLEEAPGYEDKSPSEILALLIAKATSE